MEDIYISNLIEEYKKELEDIWYKITDENIETIILWFIQISNAMLEGEIQKIENAQFKEFILSSSPIWLKFIKPENILDQLVNNLWIKSDKKLRVNYLLEVTDDFNQIVQNKLQLLNKEQNLFKVLENITIKSNLSESILKHISKDDIKNFLESSNMMEKFNKWMLTEKENKLIINFLNK